MFISKELPIVLPYIYIYISISLTREPSRFLRHNFWATFVVMEQIYDLR
jgi:hypothetical protein